MVERQEGRPNPLLASIGGVARTDGSDRSACAGAMLLSLDDPVHNQLSYPSWFSLPISGDVGLCFTESEFL